MKNNKSYKFLYLAIGWAGAAATQDKLNDHGIPYIIKNCNKIICKKGLFKRTLLDAIFLKMRIYVPEEYYEEAKSICRIPDGYYNNIPEHYFKLEE